MQDCIISKRGLVLTEVRALSKSSKVKVVFSPGQRSKQIMSTERFRQDEIVEPSNRDILNLLLLQNHTLM